LICQFANKVVGVVKVRSRVKRIALLFILLAPVSIAVLYVHAVFVSIGPSSACRFLAGASIRPGTTAAHILMSGKQERCYLLHVPARYDPAQSLPLVVVLHGLASNGETIQKVTGWDETADRESLIVVYPDGTFYPLRWNANSNMNLVVDDVQFLRELVAQISMMVSVDPKRVYVNGFSNGATMSIVMGCQAADMVAAIGLVDPGILTEETLEGCSPARAVPGIEFVGTGGVGMMGRGETDRPHREFTPFLGWLLKIDSNYEALPLRAWGERWAALNGCAPLAEQLQVGDSVKRARYRNCQRDGEVVVYTLEGMGHQWPGGKPWPSWLMGASNGEINATKEMWAFFKVHSLEREP
jgi:polyhydroxybutyrate depolymerase